MSKDKNDKIALHGTKGWCINYYYVIRDSAEFAVESVEGNTDSHSTSLSNNGHLSTMNTGNIRHCTERFAKKFDNTFV